MVTFLRAAGAALAHTRLSVTFLAFALYVVGLIVTGERWRVILAAAGSPVTIGRAISVNLAGIFVRNVTPTTGLGGDVVRVGLFRAAGVPLADAAVTLLCVRAAELPAVVGLTLLALPVLRPLTRHAPAVTLAASGAALVLVAIGVLMRGSIGDRLATWWRSISTTRIPRTALLAACGWAMAAWLETVVRLIVVAAALDVRLSFAQGCALAVLSIVGGLVPTVGSIGPIEGGLVAGLVLFGVPASSAAAITVVERAISYGISTAAGAVALAVLGGWDLVRRARGPAELAP